MAKQKIQPSFEEMIRQIAESQKPWDTAAKFKLDRASHGFGDIERLEPGVNFFVLMLEHLGCSTRFSCEGHPTGFYVFFDAPIDIADQIAARGYFTLERKNKGWIIRLSMSHQCAELGVNKTNRNNPAILKSLQRDRRRILRWAALAWQKHFIKLPEHV